MLFLPLVVAIASDNKLQCKVDYSINTLTNSSIVQWSCSTATTDWETLDIDFDIFLETKSIVHGFISMKWNKQNCIENKTSTNPSVLTQNQQKIASRCFNPATLTSKIPCSIGPLFNELFISMEIGGAIRFIT